MLLKHAMENKWFCPIEKSLAALFCVDTRTIENWKNKHPKFKEAVDEAFRIVDDTVESEMLKRTLGGFTTTEKRTNISADGEKSFQIIEKEVLSDPALLKNWLNKRRPERWKDTQEVKHSGETTTKVVFQESDMSLL